ncbi:alpha hydrolase-16 [Coleophoma cylindrospora]|uniref:Alpha hydrolase-16 n=1 Tax=Coleophoma cylindrospora TaxID=1849047 RepID=A0A3D8S8Q4_9HELO|nr:alpha hydrolase-16 [Coleophoma cylindrospora]
MSKPVFLLVPGAWHSPDSFSPTTKLLEKAGYEVKGVNLPSIGASPHHTSNEQDVQAIRNVLNPILSSGKDVVVIMHSYGGTVGSEALGEYVADMEKGEKPGRGKVVRMVFCTAFCLPIGSSLMKALEMKRMPWFIVNEDESEIQAGTPKEIFYNDISDAEAAPLIAHLKGQGYKTFFSDLTVEPWRIVPSTYILCEADNAIPIQAQEGMVAHAQSIAPNAFDVIERCSAGHSPFLSQPEWLAEKLIKSAGA